MGNLKFGSQDITALKFDTPVIDMSYTPYDNGLDFETWVINENQPSDGITVDGSTIIVTKFKPNEPLFQTNNLGTIQSVCAASKNLKFTISGLTANSSLWGWFDQTNILASGTNGYIKGFACLPYINTTRAGRPRNKWGEMPWSCYVWENITLSDNSTVQMASDLVLRGTEGGGGNNGYNRYGHYNDFVEGRVCPDWVSYYTDGDWYSNYDHQLALGLYTNADNEAIGQDGFITLEKPIYINILVEQDPVDPTTIEGFRGAVGSEQVYNKTKNFQNLWVNHNLAVYTTQFARINSQNYNSKYIMEHRSDFTNGTDAYVVSDGGSYVSKYGKIRYPIPTDLSSLITQQYPIKFCNVDSTKNNGFWDEIYNIFKNFVITDGNYYYRLFYTSNVPKMKLNVGGTGWYDDNGDWHLTPGNFIDECFSHSKIKECELVLKSGEDCHSIHELFQYCANLDTLSMTAEDSIWRIGEWSGAFEGCVKLTSLPSQLRFANTQSINVGTTQNPQYVSHCQINFGFEYSGISSIGHGEEITVYWGTQAFNACDNLTTVDLILDCQYLKPNVSTCSYMMFGYYTNRYPESAKQPSTVTSARIKNINNGDWNFDGVSHRNSYNIVGNCTLFDATSINYILNNCYDIGDAGYRIYCPEEWRSKILTSAALVAQSRGWDIYINGTLVVYTDDQPVEPSLSVFPTEVNVPQAGNQGATTYPEVTVTVENPESGVTYQIDMTQSSDSISWLTIVLPEDTGINQKSYGLMCTANNTGQARTATLTFGLDGSDESSWVHAYIYQQSNA